MQKMERDPTKRQVKPAQNLFEFDDLGESSDDSDFRIEDHCEDTDDDSIDSDSDGAEGKDDGGDDSEDDDDSDASEDDESEGGDGGNKVTVEDVLNKAKEIKQFALKDTEKIKILICCVCLGDRSDAANEIVECDGCGVTVHEGCYGVSENDSVSSTVSSCSTMPWFCEACRAGVDNPNCELCPNSGGIYKETDVGKWVHLVCALYIPGVAFGEVDKLGSVTLFEMAYSKWGAKPCQLCPDKRLARTGVAIGCDAGMCRNYFHVTCGQSNGLLSEAHCEEVEQADPFYAHCKLHSDKTLVRKRRRNWLAIQLRMEQYKEQSSKENHINSDQQLRIQRKLDKYKQKYSSFKKTRTPPWVPTQKMGRLLTTSASACRALWRKAELSGVDVEAWEVREAQVAALADIHRKWYIPPAFSVEFIGYYLDRNLRVSSMRRQLAELLDENARLIEEQKTLREKYDEELDENTKETNLNQSLKETLQKYHSVILKVAPNKRLPNLDQLGRQILSPPQTVIPSQAPVQQVRNHPLATPSGGVPTAAALKAGVGFPLGLRHSGTVNRTSSSRPEVPLNNECGICRRTNDQHLLAKCDTCHLYYHLGCLNPPLTRMPKKNKIMGWQCSECDKETSGSEVECVDPEAPRKLRNVKDNGDSKSIKSDGEKTNESLEDSKLVTESEVHEVNEIPGLENQDGTVISGRPGKKRRREKHRRYSPEPLGSSQSSCRPHKRKRKHKSLDSTVSSGTTNTSSTSISDNEPRQPLKICFKSIPHPTGEGSAYVATPSQGVTRTITTTSAHVVLPMQISTPTPQISQLQQQTPPINVQPPVAIRTLAARKKEEPATLCSTCNTLGTSLNLVRCDECLKGFHFHCLDPPVKKSPKVRGYSWHCADCDPTENDTDVETMKQSDSQLSPTFLP